jgi:hypothetical protein
MRYIAIFTLFAIPVAKGFASKKEAIYCLEQAHNDTDSSPLGIYDVSKDKVTYHHDKNYTGADIDESLLIRLAQSYIERIV